MKCMKNELNQNLNSIVLRCKRMKISFWIRLSYEPTKSTIPQEYRHQCVIDASHFSLGAALLRPFVVDLAICGFAQSFHQSIDAELLFQKRFFAHRTSSAGAFYMKLFQMSFTESAKISRFCTSQLNGWIVIVQPLSSDRFSFLRIFFQNDIFTRNAIESLLSTFHFISRLTASQIECAKIEMVCASFRFFYTSVRTGWRTEWYWISNVFQAPSTLWTE